MTTEPVRLAEVLEEAAEELFRNGHVRKSFGRVDGPKCALGALTWAVTRGRSVGDPYADLRGVEPDWHRDPYFARADFLRDLFRAVAPSSVDLARERVVPGGCPLPHPDGRLIIWNDHPGRTPGQVIDRFKHAAKDLRNGETCGSSG